MEKDAVNALHTAAEDYIIDILNISREHALDAKRNTVTLSDFKWGKRVIHSKAEALPDVKFETAESDVQVLGNVDASTDRIVEDLLGM